MYSKNDLYLTSNDFSSFADIIYSDRQKYTEELFNSNNEIVEYSKDKQFKHITCLHFVLITYALNLS